MIKVKTKSIWWHYDTLKNMHYADWKFWSGLIFTVNKIKELYKRNALVEME